MTNSPADNTFTRRHFIQQGMTFISLAATAPLFIQQSANSMMLPFGSPVSSQAGVPEDHVLVVVQLGGGNDGLNTVVPYGNSSYYKLRNALAIPAPGKGGSNPNQAAALKLGAKARKPLAGSIGPTTTATMKQLGLPVDFEATEASLDSLVAALLSRPGTR